MFLGTDTRWYFTPLMSKLRWGSISASLQDRPFDSRIGSTKYLKNTMTTHVVGGPQDRWPCFGLRRWTPVTKVNKAFPKCPRVYMHLSLAGCLKIVFSSDFSSFRWSQGQLWFCFIGWNTTPQCYRTSQTSQWVRLGTSWQTGKVDEKWHEESLAFQSGAVAMGWPRPAVTMVTQLATNQHLLFFWNSLFQQVTWGKETWSMCPHTHIITHSKSKCNWYSYSGYVSLWSKEFFDRLCSFSFCFYQLENVEQL